MNNKPNTKAEILKKLIEKRELDKPFELEDIDEGYVPPIDKLKQEMKGIGMIGNIKKYWQYMSLGLKIIKIVELYKELGMKAFLGSKKVKALVLGVVSLVLVNVIGLPEDQVAKIMETLTYLFVTYLGAQGVSDYAEKRDVPKEVE